jgi:hypothetical protein
MFRQLFTLTIYGALVQTPIKLLKTPTMSDIQYAIYSRIELA